MGNTAKGRLANFGVTALCCILESVPSAVLLDVYLAVTENKLRHFTIKSNCQILPFSYFVSTLKVWSRAFLPFFNIASNKNMYS